MRPIILAVFIGLLPAAAKGGCAGDQHGGVVCGAGRAAARVVENTTSPSKTYAVAWRCSEGMPSGENAPRGDIENVLIRLDDGRVIGKLGSTYWDTGALRPNRDELFAAWSADSRAVVEGTNSRWDTDVLDYFAVDADTVKKLDLLALISPAIKAKVPASERDGYSLRVRQDLGVGVAGDRIRFKAMLYVPKSEASLDYNVEVAIASKGGTPSGRIAALRRIRIDPRL